MAHFSEIKTDNNEVIRTVVINDNDISSFGENSVEAENWVATNIPDDDYLKEYRFSGNYPETYWKRTSYNTKQNQHENNGIAFRGNYAGPAHVYDSVNDVFWPASPFASWVKNNSIADWEAPVTFPPFTQDIDGTRYEMIPKWDEDNLKWIGTTAGDSPKNVEWDADNNIWNLI